MNEEELTAEGVCEQLDSGSPVVLVSAIDLQGSTPRHGGAKMVVSASGAVCGTIGGGLLEAAATMASRQALDVKQSRLMDFDLGGVDASNEGMICGGTASLLLDYVTPARENIEFFRAYHDLVLKGRDFYSLTVLTDEADRVVVAGRSLLLKDGTLTGSYSWPEEQLQAVKSHLRNVSTAMMVAAGDHRVVVDRIRRTKTVYCFGAGHVGLATARVATLAGFRVTVVDDRADFANTERFPDANGVVVIKDFDHALDGLPIDEDSYVVILTRGHRYDQVVLQQALRTNAGYIGMIGSQSKRDATYLALLDEGVAPEQLKRVHSPIGLPINAETPDEIAVSIVAELIAERARGST